MSHEVKRGQAGFRARASAMGKRAHALGRAPEWTPDAARAAGSKGGSTTAAKGREYMAALGRKGAEARNRQRLRERGPFDDPSTAVHDVHDTEPAPPPSEDGGAP